MELTKNERSLLLYFETQAVDYGGLLQGEKMSPEDLEIAAGWNRSGFVKFGRVSFSEFTPQRRTHWCVLSPKAWEVAHAARKARAEDPKTQPTETRIGLDAE